MLDVSALYGGLDTVTTEHRYGRRITQVNAPAEAAEAEKPSASRRPVVVFNVTRTCNLHCEHCYADAGPGSYHGELDTRQAKAVLDDLAGFGVSTVIFSGGEPLVRADVFDLIHHARRRDLHVSLSTNATLIDRAMAWRLKDHGVCYVGVSLDSVASSVHDQVRNMRGAFAKAIKGYKASTEVGIKTGLRLPLAPTTMRDLAHVFDFVEALGAHRVCFYHACPSGRHGSEQMVLPAQTRTAVDLILSRTREMVERGQHIEVQTADNPCDGPYLYLRMLREGHPRAEQVRQMLAWNGGGLFGSGVGVACIDVQGNVHADPFSRYRVFGNVLQRSFGEIWQDTSDDIMAGLKNRLPLLEGRCGKCRFKNLCGGGLRTRAELLTGKPWASDPACYLNDSEIHPPHAVDEFLPVGVDAMPRV